MYEKRICELLGTCDAQSVLIQSSENLYYFSGFTGGEGALFLSKNRRLLFTDSRYTVQAAQESPNFEIVDVAKTSLSAFLKDEGVCSIGFEEDFVTFKTFLGLKKISETITWLPLSDKISEIRTVKDEKELNAIKTAAAIACKAFETIINEIAPGKTEREIALKLEYDMLSLGAEGLSFPTISASGVRSALPHGTATDKKLEKGDFFTLDFGCKYKGYCSDMTRTVVLGTATDQQKEIYETVLCAQTAALASLKSGVVAKEIDAIARSIIEEKGYGKHFGHGLGHSVGLCVHEAPSLSPNCDKLLKTNMLMTVEPGIYMEGFGGVRIEDLVIIKENGTENLVSAPKTLLEL